MPDLDRRVIDSMLNGGPIVEIYRVHLARFTYSSSEFEVVIPIRILEYLDSGTPYKFRASIQGELCWKNGGAWYLDGQGDSFEGALSNIAMKIPMNLRVGDKLFNPEPDKI